MYVADFNSNSVSVIQDSALGIAERGTPAVRRLSLEAYPNPFRGQLSLRLTADGLRPEVRIYDVDGVQVRDLTPPRSLAPRFAYSLVWDGTDNLGRRLAAGVYVVRLTDGVKSVHRKVLLLR